MTDHDKLSACIPTDGYGDGPVVVSFTYSANVNIAMNSQRKNIVRISAHQGCQSVDTDEVLT